MKFWVCSTCLIRLSSVNYEWSVASTFLTNYFVFGNIVLVPIVYSFFVLENWVGSVVQNYWKRLVLFISVNWGSFSKFKSFPMLKVIFLKTITVRWFLLSCPVYQNIQNSWLCQCLTISVIFIKFLENLVCCRKLQIWSHLLKKSLMENFIFCAVSSLCQRLVQSCPVSRSSHET